MINTKEVEVIEKKKEIVSITCDKCGKTFTPSDIIDWQECQLVSFTGGYGSVFGDGATIECDLCQECVKELIGEYCRVSYDEL